MSLDLTEMKIIVSKSSGFHSGVVKESTLFKGTQYLLLQGHRGLDVFLDHWPLKNEDTIFLQDFVN
jgi:hypothetical protein